MGKIVLMAFLILTTLSSTYAEDKGDGCGIGNHVWNKHSFLATSVRGTTNGVLGIVNLGATTSGSLGCAKHDIVRKEKQKLHFIETNHDEVLSEIASGKGEYLEGFARALGCEDKSYTVFSKQMKLHYPMIMNGRNPVDTLNNVEKIISSDFYLATACKA